MKKVQLIEYGIIVIGLIFGYKAFDAFFTALFQVFYMFEGFGPEGFGELLPSIVMVAVYATCFVLVLRKSEQIAVSINKMSSNETVPLQIGKRSLLQVILIAICASTILFNITEILLYIFDKFLQEAGTRNRFEGADPGRHSFKVALARTIIAVVVIAFSKDISRWFVKRDEVDELVFDNTDKKD